MNNSIFVEIGSHETSIPIDDELREFLSDFITENPYHLGRLYRSFFLDALRVRDVSRYCAVVHDNSVTKLKRHRVTKHQYSRYRDRDVEANRESIVLVMESPHKDEFFYLDGKLQPITPAQGKTGKCIQLSLKDKLNELLAKSHVNISNGEYQVVLMNPIQWQTSLYDLYKDPSTMHSRLRDKIWKQLWELPEVRVEFINRLGMYNPILIINACTGRNYGDSLKSAVRKEIKEKFTTTILPIGHPSSWK